MKRPISILLFVASFAVLGAQIEVVSSGSVGVGTATPGTKLSVNGSIGVGPDELPIQESNFGYGTSYKVLRLGTNQASRSLALNVDPLTVTGGGFSGAGQILLPNAGLLAPNAAGTDWMGVLRAVNDKVYLGGTISSGDLVGDGLVVSGGKVGIGPLAPVYKLHVSGSTPQMVIQDTSGTSDAWGIGANNTTQRLGIINNTSGYGEVVSILRTGNVGIGTTNPGYKLEVVGTVRATSFISNTTTYADFVFDPQYRLAPLSEVEAHIREKRHLPGIPSEAEARAQGIDLAAMQVKLLQKVEELTLHQIAQEKQLREQTVRLAALERENAQLKSRP